MKSRYFQLANLCDWVIYILAILFTFNFCIDYETAGCKGQRVRNFDPNIDTDMIYISFQCWQWPVGSFLITASWLNLLTYFRSVPFFGIYILMFNDILNTATRFSVILLVFLVAFGLGFHLVFINQVRKRKENILTF